MIKKKKESAAFQEKRNIIYNIFTWLLFKKHSLTLELEEIALLAYSIYCTVAVCRSSHVWNKRWNCMYLFCMGITALIIQKVYLKKLFLMSKYSKDGTFNYTFKINWIRRYFIPHYVFTSVGGLKFMLQCTYNVDPLHKQMLLAWCLIYKHYFTPHMFLFGTIDLFFM